MTIASLRRCALSLLLAGLLALPLPAQAPLPDYSKGNSHFPNLFAPYAPKPVAVPNLAPSPRVDDLIQGGRLYLSVQDAIYLAIENNLDIATARYDPATTATTLLSAKGGSVIGPVRVSGAALDPRISSTLSIQRSYLPLNNPFLAGTGTTVTQAKFNQDIGRGAFSYVQGFDTGTAFSVGWDSRRTYNNPSGSFFNHNIQTGL